MNHQRTTMNQTPYTRFTFLELVIVLIVLGLALALVIPRVGHLPGEIARQQLFSKIERAFRYAGIRARATGSQVQVQIKKEQNTMALSGGDTKKDRQKSQRAFNETNTGDAAEQEASLLPKADTVQLSQDIVWEPGSAQTPSEELSYTFFPSGEATGPSLNIEFRGENYDLRIDELTGAPVINRNINR